MAEQLETVSKCLILVHPQDLEIFYSIGGGNCDSHTVVSTGTDGGPGGFPVVAEVAGRVIMLAEQELLALVITVDQVFNGTSRGGRWWRWSR